MYYKIVVTLTFHSFVRLLQQICDHGMSAPKLNVLHRVLLTLSQVGVIKDY